MKIQTFPTKSNVLLVGPRVGWAALIEQMLQPALLIGWNVASAQWAAIVLGGIRHWLAFGGGHVPFEVRSGHCVRALGARLKLVLVLAFIQQVLGQCRDFDDLLTP